MPVDCLHIENNRDLAKLTKTFRERTDYDVILAEWGEEAVKMLETAAVKIVLLDIMLPDMNGFQVCALIRGRDALKYGEGREIRITFDKRRKLWQQKG